jgi:cupin fold WbuC family metalloprotein
MTLKAISPEVLAAPQPISMIDFHDIDTLKAALATSPRGRVRINLHPDGDDGLHEMIIAIDSRSYIRPHMHPGKSEAFHLISGTVDIVVFDDRGEIARIVPLSTERPGGAFYYRMSKPFFHTLIIRSDVLVVHEITNGPFVKGASVVADFAPDESDAAAGARYCADLRQRIVALGPAAR